MPKGVYRKLACFWCRKPVDVGPETTIVVCSNCVSQGARLPPPDVRLRRWEHKKTDAERMKEGMIFE